MNERYLEKFALDQKIALITGGASGLGLGYVEAFLEAGASVVIADIDKETGDHVAQGFQAKGLACRFAHADLLEHQSVPDLFANVADREGRLDILVNNAGGWTFGPAEQASQQNWQRIIDLNLTATQRCCQEAGRLMLPQCSGSIINVGSISGFLINYPDKDWLEPAYFAAKAGIIHLTRALAAQWGPRGLRVNCISPGYMTKEGLSQAAMSAPYVARIPLGRPGLPEEIGYAATFLSSAAASYINGINLVVDGGFSVW